MTGGDGRKLGVTKVRKHDFGGDVGYLPISKLTTRQALTNDQHVVTDRNCIAMDRAHCRLKDYAPNSLLMEKMGL